VQGHPLARGALRRAAAAALALALAAPAEAAPRRETAAVTPARATAPATPAAAPPARTPAAAPLRATPPAAAPLPLPPQPPAAAVAPDARVGWLTLAVGAWAGFDLGQSLAAQVDYGIERTPPSWTRLGLEYHLSVMGSRPTDETDLTRTIVQPYYPYQTTSVPAGVESTEAWVVEVALSARARLPFEKFALFADGGVGVAQSVERVERDEMFEGTTVSTENVTGLVLKLGAGMSFDLGARTRLLLVPVALSVQLGPSYSAYTPYLGLSYRL
jgi:hypothetical protein